MDGEKVTAAIKAGLRGAGLVLAVSLAMIPVAFLTTSEGHAADDVPASARYAVGSAGMLTAQSIAVANWGGTPCGGAIDVSWGPDDPTINARSYWANPNSAYDNPDLNTQCRVVFNVSMTFTWEKFCTVLVHEYGHLSGKPHTADGPDLMSPIYRAPLPVCSATPDPWAAAQAVVAPPVTAPVATTPAPVVDVATPARSTTKRTTTRAAKARAQARAAKAKAARAQLAKAKASRAKAAKARAASVPLQQYSTADSDRW
jgi:hypothetical protein